MKSVNDIMPMIGARFYTQLDAAQVKCDVLEGELAKVQSLRKISAIFWWSLVDSICLRVIFGKVSQIDQL